MTDKKLRFRNTFAISSLALSVGLGCWLVLPSSADDDAPGTNLIQNGTMDETLKDDSNQIAHWTKSGDIEGVKYLWAHADTRGDASKKNPYLAIKKTANRYMPIAAWEQTLDSPLTAPAITVKAKVRASNVTKAIIDVIFLDDKDEWMQHKWVAYIGSPQIDGPLLNHNWKLYEGTVAIPDDAKKIRISLQDYGPGTVYFDDVSAHFENDTSKITDAVQVAMANETRIPATSTPDTLEIPTGIDPNRRSTEPKPAVQSYSYATPALTYAANPATPSATPSASYVPVTPGLPGSVIAATPTTPPAIAARGQYVPQAASSYTNVPPVAYVPANSAYNQLPQDPYANYARGNSGASQQGDPGWQPFAEPKETVEAVYQQQVPVTKTDYVDGRPVTTTSYVIKHITSDGQQFASPEIASAHAQTLRLAANLQKETDADAKAKLREELTAAVTNEYQQLRAERQKEVDELAKKLEDVRANLTKRDEEKSKIIDARVEHLASKPLVPWSYNRPVNSQQYQNQTFLAPVPVVPPFGSQFNPVGGFYQSTPPGITTNPAASTVPSYQPIANPNALNEPTPSRSSNRASSTPTPAVEAKPPAVQPTLNTSDPFVTQGPANTPKEAPVEATPAQPPQPSQPTQAGR